MQNERIKTGFAIGSSRKRQAKSLLSTLNGNKARFISHVRASVASPFSIHFNISICSRVHWPSVKSGNFTMMRENKKKFEEKSKEFIGYEFHSLGNASDWLTINKPWNMNIGWTCNWKDWTTKLAKAHFFAARKWTTGFNNEILIHKKINNCTTNKNWILKNLITEKYRRIIQMRDEKTTEKSSYFAAMLMNLTNLPLVDCY